MAKRDLNKLQKALRGGARTNPGAGLAVEASPTNIVIYKKQIIKQVSKPFWQDVKKELLPLLKRLEPDYVRNDVIVDQITQVLGGLRAEWGDIGETADNLATRWAAENDEFHREKFIKSLSDSIGVNMGDILTDFGLEEQLESAVETNVNLITSIPQKDLDRIESTIWNGLKTGDDFRSLRKEILSIVDMDERRATLIARDQTSKLNASLNRTRQTDVGIDGYFWRTSGDGPPRVRATHWANRNKRFRWDTPPSKTGHPGHDVNCRCYADPDLRGLRVS